MRKHFEQLIAKNDLEHIIEVHSLNSNIRI